MNRSSEIAHLAAALVLFQAEVGAVKKGAVNPFFKSRYADLASIIEAIRAPLAAQGLAFSQFPSGEYGLTTLLMHSSGEYIEESFIMRPVDAKPQSLGSAITYARRYALSAVLGISTEEDDDGNEASKPGAPARMPSQRPRNDSGSTMAPPADMEIIRTEDGAQYACSYAGCMAPITQAEHEYSINIYKQPLCRPHQTKARNAKPSGTAR